jgi:hypothetical protein
MVGLGVQLATIVFFCGVVGKFHVLTRRGEVKPEVGDGWRKVLKAVYISSGLIVVSRTSTLILSFGNGLTRNRSVRCTG